MSKLIKTERGVMENTLNLQWTFQTVHLTFHQEVFFFQLLLICNVSQQPHNPPDTFSTCQQQMSWQAG